MPRFVPVFLMAAVAALWLGVAFASAERDAALRGAEYLRGAQESDGGFGGFGPGQTFDTVFAFRSVGIDPATVTTDGNSPADFLRANLEEVTESAGLAAKAALAAVAMGLDPRDVDGVDLIGAIVGFHDEDSGAFADDAFSHGLAVLGLACTGNDAPNGALEYLREAQLDDGGWGFEEDGDPDTTAIALQAYIAGGGSAADETGSAALAFFAETQASDGGWGFEPDESNANSTAYVIQALMAAGEDQAGYAINGATPMEALLALQQEDGSFAGFDPVFATAQTVPALAGRTFCDAPMTELDASSMEDAPAEPEPAAVGTGLADRGQPLPFAGLGAALMVAGAAMFVASRRFAR